MWKILLLICALFFAKIEAAPAYAQLSSLSTQVPPSGKFAQLHLDSVDVLKNIDISPSKDQIIIKERGVYFVLAAGQIGSTSAASTGYVDFWFLKNGAQIANSGVRMSVDPSNATGVLISQNVLELREGDTLSMGYTSSGSSIGFIFLRPDNEPAIPSMIFTVLKIDAFEADQSHAPK